jgi:hypothetical protein
VAGNPELPLEAVRSTGHCGPQYAPTLRVGDGRCQESPVW